MRFFEHLPKSIRSKGRWTWSNAISIYSIDSGHLGNFRSGRLTGEFQPSIAY